MVTTSRLNLAIRHITYYYIKHRTPTLNSTHENIVHLKHYLYAKKSLYIIYTIYKMLFMNTQTRNSLSGDVKMAA